MIYFSIRLHSQCFIKCIGGVIGLVHKEHTDIAGIVKIFISSSSQVV
jgi:hypothetical protein